MKAKVVLGVVLLAALALSSGLWAGQHRGWAQMSGQKIAPEGSIGCSDAPAMMRAHAGPAGADCKARALWAASRTEVQPNCSAPGCHNDWAIWVNNNESTVMTANVVYSDYLYQYGPFFTGQLGGGGLWDVAVTPDNKYALVSNFGQQKIYRIDLCDPTLPVLAGSITLPFPAEDVAISPDGVFALVTDGGDENRIASIDLATFTLLTTYTLTTPGGGAQAVAIAPSLSTLRAENGVGSYTVVVADTYSNRIIYGLFSPATGFAVEKTLPTQDAPINVAISPDGQTVLVPNFLSASVNTFQIPLPGDMVGWGAVTGLPDLPQVVAIEPAGGVAWVVSDLSPTSMLSYLDITGPGVASLGGAGVLCLQAGHDSGAFGVDEIAVTKDGSTLVVGCPFGSSVDTLFTVSTDHSVGWHYNSWSTGHLFPFGLDTFYAEYGTCMDTSFYDDNGRSQFCVNTPTGNYKWSILKGTGSVSTAQGTLKVLNGGTLFTSFPNDPNSVYLVYDVARHKANGYFYGTPFAVTGAALPLPSKVYSPLVDKNTRNDPPCTPAIPPPTNQNGRTAPPQR